MKQQGRQVPCFGPAHERPHEASQDASRLLLATRADWQTLFGCYHTDSNNNNTTTTTTTTISTETMLASLLPGRVPPADKVEGWRLLGVWGGRREEGASWLAMSSNWGPSTAYVCAMCTGYIW